MLEIEAGKFLANCFKEAFIKTVKFKENPKPDELNKQLILVKNQFNAIIAASITLEKCIYRNPSNGCTVDGVDWIPVGLIYLPEDIEYAISVFQSFIKAWNGDDDE